MPALKIKWLGHSAFELTTPDGKRIITDPWLTGNPKVPPGTKIENADLILVSHGHFDHAADAVPVAQATGAPVVSCFELCTWMQSKGVKNVSPGNIGGSQEIGGVTVTMVPAIHSSAWADENGIQYLGEPAGFVIKLADGYTAYFAGDTALYGDMRLIREMYGPHLAFLPIGDRFTMGPEGAARAAELLGVREVVPMHYGTFPLLTGTPERFRELASAHNVSIVEVQPGQVVGG